MSGTEPCFTSHFKVGIYCPAANNVIVLLYKIELRLTFNKLCTGNDMMMVIDMYEYTGPAIIYVTREDEAGLGIVRFQQKENEVPAFKLCPLRLCHIVSGGATLYS